MVTVAMKDVNSSLYSCDDLHKVSLTHTDKF